MRIEYFRSPLYLYRNIEFTEISEIECKVTKNISHTQIFCEKSAIFFLYCVFLWKKCRSTGHLGESQPVRRALCMFDFRDVDRRL